MKLVEDKNLDKILAQLPRYSFSVRKIRMEPVTLVVLGSKPHIRSRMTEAGWYLAAKINLLTTIRSAIATIFNSSYRNGPMWPAYINGHKHRMAFEMPTKSDTYRRRHHIRLWRSKYKWHGKSVWIGMASYDRSAGFIKKTPLPAHHINPNLKAEDDYIVRTLELMKPLFVRLAPPEEGIINTGDAYVWDGKALVMDLSQ
jgi:undecaprenyl-diphosphatase